MSTPDRLVFIIAEAGVNHNGDPNLAMQMVDVAGEAGANAVKFQTFDAKALVTSSAEKARYQQVATNSSQSQQQMLTGLQLDGETHRRLKRRAEKHGLLFMSTAFDSPSLTFLANHLNLPLLKIPSGEITNGPLLLQYAQTGRDLVLSTGMSTIAEVKAALSVLAFGLTGRNSPSTQAFDQAFTSQEGREALRAHVTLLHCTTQYPASLSSVNLKAMISLQEVFGLRIGYSDHTPGAVVACAAAALGARVIEKHFTLDNTLPGPDHKASLEPLELKQMIESVRMVEQALGDGQKVPHATEMENRPVARKSLVAAHTIRQGEIFSPENVAVKRPGTGRSPMEYWDLLGRKSNRDHEFDEFL
ncbi:MAG: N-acetylneuraminate synthase [Gammaproteobacteria bacterium]|jgi:N-acetylneuraminate synthase|nr:N-acetylneuraminate synthase [Gammaproteobacteria bacterium]|tara:strand:- start:708 stop:1787 length:1080 start_codon:yes stop_codon:yes gene_type:complete